MAAAVHVFDGASMLPGMRAVFAGANVSLEFAPLIVVAEHAGDRTLCDGLTIDHVADMNFGKYATSQRPYATHLIGIRDGVAAVPAVAQVLDVNGAVVTAAVAAVAAIPGVGGLDSVTGTTDECVDAIMHPLMRLHRAAQNELARLAPGGNLTAEKLADALGGQAVADRPAHRVRTLDEGAVAGLLAAGYTAGVHRPDFAWERPGSRLVSVMAHHASVLPDAGVRKARTPLYRDVPFDAVISEDGILVHTPACPTSASLIGAFGVWFFAWELCAAQAAKPADFSGSGARLSGGGAAVFKAVIIALHRLKGVEPTPLLEQLKLLQDQFHYWSEGTVCDGWYPKAVERLDSIRFVIASRGSGAAVVAAVISSTSSRRAARVRLRKGRSVRSRRGRRSPASWRMFSARTRRFARSSPRTASSGGAARAAARAAAAGTTRATARARGRRARRGPLRSRRSVTTSSPVVACAVQTAVTPTTEGVKRAP